MLKQKVVHVLAAAVVGLCWIIAVSAANAESDTASQQIAIRQACTDQGGRFEQSWIYNDQGMQWGKVLTCSTSAAYITCQDNVCRGGRWVPRDGVTTANGGPDNNDGAVQFPAEPVAFSAALTALSGK